MASRGGQRQSSFNSLCKLYRLSGCQRGEKTEMWIYRVNVLKEKDVPGSREIYYKDLFQRKVSENAGTRFWYCCLKRQLGKKKKQNFFLLHSLHNKWKRGDTRWRFCQEISKRVREAKESFEAPDKHLLQKKYHKDSSRGCLIMRKSLFFPKLHLLLG